MIYAIYVQHNQSGAVQLGQALAGKHRDVTYYVIGMTDAAALGRALLGHSGQVIDSAETKVEILTLAKAAKFIEAIGKPDGVVTEDQLRTIAEARVKELEASDASR